MLTIGQIAIRYLIHNLENLGETSDTNPPDNAFLTTSSTVERFAKHIKRPPPGLSLFVHFSFHQAYTLVRS